MKLSKMAKMYLEAEKWADQHEHEMFVQLRKEREKGEKAEREKEAHEKEKTT